MQPAQPMEDDDEHGGGHAGVEGRPGAGENTTAAKLLYKAIQEDDLETIRRLVEGKVRTTRKKRGGNCGKGRGREGGQAGGARGDPRRLYLRHKDMVTCSRRGLRGQDGMQDRRGRE